MVDDEQTKDNLENFDEANELSQRESLKNII
jgi:hypothetical protein